MSLCQRIVKTAVVTGPTGAIGIALCQRLLDEGVTVYAVCRPSSVRMKRLPVSEHLHLICCDADDLERLPNLISPKVNAFFHLAWDKTCGTGRNNMQTQVQNISYTIGAVHAAAALGCEIFVGTGSQAEYGRTNCPLKPNTPCYPENGYGMAKLCAGQMSRVECRKLGLSHVWMRILSVYGPGDSTSSMITSTIQSLLEGKIPSLTGGEQLWDYLYSSDAADALFLAAQYGRNGAVYPLGSGMVQPLRKYMEELRNTIDPALPLGIGTLSYDPQQVMFLQADINTLQTDTGFNPHTTFSEGIKATIDWVKSTKRDHIT